MDIDNIMHSFCRGAVSNLLENGHRIESVVEVSGHLNINITKGYLVREEKLKMAQVLLDFFREFFKFI